MRIETEGPYVADIVLLTNEYGGQLAACDRHIASERRYLVGEIAESRIVAVCEQCRTERQRAEAPAVMRAALLSSDFSHTRFKYSQVHAYRHDDTSPSGFMLAASLDEPRYNAVVAQLRDEGIRPLHGGYSPLSPTEAR